MSNKLQNPTTGAFLNTARQYHEAARKLFPQREFVELPLYFLYAHAIELLLKAYLRAHSLPIKQSHDLGFFLEQCKQNGLRVHSDLQNVVNLLESENKRHGFRYYSFASTTKPEISYVSEIVDDLMEVVSDYVKNNPEIVPKKTIVKLTFSKPMPKDAMSFPPSNAATYERARRLANQALWTVDLQRRRLNSDEPEDSTFILRKWSDFHFLIVALTRLRRAAELAAKVPAISERMRVALENFDAALPNLKKMRDVAEHIDDYAVDGGKDRSISRKSLEVGSSDGEVWCWLGFEINADLSLSASAALFGALKNCAPLIKMESDNSPETTVPANP